MVFAKEFTPHQRIVLDRLANGKSYSCGQEIYIDGLYVNANLNCMKRMESVYYSQNLGTICCYNCATEIIDKKIISEVQKLSQDFHLVLPSCRNGCPAHFTSRGRKIISKASDRVQKRKCEKRSNNQAARKRRRKERTDRYQNALESGTHIPMLTGSNITTWLKAVKGFWGQL